MSSDKERKRDYTDSESETYRQPDVAKPSNTGRSFSKSWLKTISWLEYNEELQMIFAKYLELYFIIYIIPLTWTIASSHVIPI